MANTPSKWSLLIGYPQVSLLAECAIPRRPGLSGRTTSPNAGKQTTVQGELIRAVEKLRDEAQRNGNVNWSNDHVILVEYVRDTLTESGLFDQAAVSEIEQDATRLR